MKQPKLYAACGWSYEIDENRLIISVDNFTRGFLRDSFPNKECQDNELHELFEPLTNNSELEWIDPAVTGDLTGAPMLGIYGEPVPGTEGHGHYVGGWEIDGGVVVDHYAPVDHRWAFMDYAVRCVIEDLIDTGEVVFVGE